ncbi:hypothetical protein ACN24M_00450 [Streptomyces microflavus]
MEELGEAGAFGLVPAGADAARVVQLPAVAFADEDGAGQAGQPAAPRAPTRRR